MTILEFDKKFTNAGIPKEVDSEYFHIQVEKYDKVYADRIKSIVELDK